MPATKTVGEIMTRDVITVNEEDNLADLEVGMSTYAMRHLPVVDGRRLVGLLTHRDLLRMAQLPGETFVAQAMTRDVRTARPETPVREATRRLVENKFGCLPVVDAEGALVGIVTEHDLLKLLVHVLGEE